MDFWIVYDPKGRPMRDTVAHTRVRALDAAEVSQDVDGTVEWFVLYRRGYRCRRFTGLLRRI